MFQHRDRHARTPAREVAISCLEAGIAAAQPDRLVADALSLDGDLLRIADATYDLSAFDRLFVLGGGKAAGGLAVELDALLGDRIDDGLVVTTAGSSAEVDAGRIDVGSGTHPVPSGANVEATRELLALAREADAETLVLAVITGGASALLTAPADGLDVADLAATTDALLESGASIDEINAVRKHCSAIKGGRLAAAAPASVVALAISDVVGDDPAVIGSGPTVPDSTTFEEARAVLDRYGLLDRVPDAVVAHLDAGIAGDVAETPAPDDPAFDDTDWHCLASGRAAIEAARDAAEAAGYEPLVLSSRVRGEAVEAGRFHAAVAAESAARGEPVEPPAALISGGEVTVTVDGNGTGGPNQELALAAAIDFAESETDAVLASVDTDGIDGTTDAAGAIVDAKTVADRESVASAALGRNDAGTMLDETNALLRTGPTGTNVNDLRAVVIEASA